MAEVLGLGQADPGTILTWYDGIVAAVQAEGAAAGRGRAADGATSVAAGGTAAFGELAASLREVIARGGSLLAEVTGPLAEAPLAEEEAISNAAVLMFGGIETTEGMIANAVLHLLSSPVQLALVLADPALVPVAVEESLRLEPAAAVVDPDATADTPLRGAAIPGRGHGNLSLAPAPPAAPQGRPVWPAPGGEGGSPPPRRRRRPGPGPPAAARFPPRVPRWSPPRPAAGRRRRRPSPAARPC